MKTLRQFINEYCQENGLIPKNVPNDTFVDIENDTKCISVRKRNNKVTFKCNNALVRFIIVDGYLTYIYL